ncbi:ABC transporter permease [Planktotalea sp.]|uniref:ABC transporter permease n=1 Tax=Planktotalea sp. TaxID=2029877 RepID=UPI003D6C1E60
MPRLSSAPQMLHVVVSLTGLVLLWSFSAWLGSDPTILPSPGAVWQLMVAETQSGELPRHMWATFRRVLLAFSLAMVFGLFIGLALGRSARLNQWFSTWLVVFLNIPALVVIVLCYLWIGLNEVAAITAVALNKTAMVAVSIREGVHALNPWLSEMARAFRMSRLTELRHVTLPQLWPYIASSMRNGLAIIWKIVLVVEFLGRSDGVGFQIHLYFQLFETGYVLAYALSFVVVMLVIEYGVIGVLERRAVRWRATT